MIYNGNYKNDTINNLIPVIYESFVEYYGKQYELILKERIDRISFLIYHTKEYIENYYNNFISKYRDQILDRFYEKYATKRNSDLDEFLFGKNKPISETKLNIACEGGEDVESNYIFSKESIKTILDYRKEITKLLGLSEYNHDNYNQLMQIRNIFLDCVREIENENNCDVFDDIRTIDNNTKKILKCFFDDIADYYRVSENDLKNISSKKFDLSILNLLDCNKLFFNDSLEESGLITAFDECSNYLLKKGTENEKLEIIIKRLMYLNHIGVHTNIDNNTLMQYLNKIKDSSNDENAQDDMMKYEIYKEYKYQKANPIINVLIKDISQNEFEKSWKNGNFIPVDVAEDLEFIRKDYCNQIEENTKFPKSKFQSDLDFVTKKYFKNDSILEPHNLISMCEDYIDDVNFYLEVLVHEINHAVSEETLFKYSKGNVTTKSGISFSGYKTKDLKILGQVSISETIDLEEYVNQKQANEILSILKRKMQEKNIKIETDCVINPDKQGCIYDYYEILGKDFYNMFREQLKLQNIDQNYSMFFDFDLPYNKTQVYLEKAKNKVNRIFRPDYFSEGSVDFYKVEELSKLIKEFDKKIMPKIFGIVPKEDFLSGNFEKLSTDTRLELFRLLEKKDKIMQGIIEDEKRIDRSSY